METLRKLVEANRQAYIMIMQKAKQAELDRVFSGSNISILSPPSVPLGAVSPNKGRIVLIGALLGLLGGIGFALVIDHFDTSAQKPQDVEKLLNVPILGTLPLVGSPARFMEELRINSRMDPKVSTVEFAAFKFPTAPFTDAIRIVQNAASGALRAGPGGVAMCVSSALPLEGKTLIAVFMATVTATEDKKVLVIDGDMRRPRIQQVFKASSDLPGLSDVLSGKCENIREVIHRSKVPGLFYMTAGSPPDNPVSLLKSDKFKEMLDTCRGWFDYVFIDTPPILGLVDTTVLAGNVDGTVLVAKAGHTPLEVLRQAKETVSRGQGRILGVVLNMADQKAHRYTAYRYFGYNYYSHNYYSKRENNDKQA
jgi:capsular exopolysaccharide synthesis family protein